MYQLGTVRAGWLLLSVSPYVAVDRGCAVGGVSAATAATNTRPRNTKNFLSRMVASASSLQRKFSKTASPRSVGVVMMVAALVGRAEVHGLRSPMERVGRTVKVHLVEPLAEGVQVPRIALEVVRLPDGLRVWLRHSRLQPLGRRMGSHRGRSLVVMPVTTRMVGRRVGSGSPGRSRRQRPGRRAPRLVRMPRRVPDEPQN
jgi:ribosomal protein S19